jgi:altronate dehydratase
MNAKATKYMEAAVMYMSSTACPMVDDVVALLHGVGCLVESCAVDVPSKESFFTSSVPLALVCSLSHCCNSG